jgi:hypothetical protein
MNILSKYTKKPQAYKPGDEWYPGTMPTPDVEMEEN